LYRSWQARWQGDSGSVRFDVQALQDYTAAARALGWYRYIDAENVLETKGEMT
jgi:hypothetical protein